jgi:GNAT superfamily N-acetyltransferase
MKRLNDSDFEFCSAGPEGLDEIQTLWEKLNRLHTALSPHFGELASQRTFDARKNELLEMSMTGWIRVDLATERASGQTIGYVVATLSQDAVGEIESIFVEEASRRKGVGKSLLKRSLSWLDECGARMKRINVAVGNEMVFEFYRKFGFYPITTTLLQAEMIIRKAVASDIDEIYKMHVSSIHELCSNRYSSEKIDAWTSTLNPDRYLQAINELDFRVAQNGDGRLAGFIIADVSRGEVSALYVAPNAAGKGLGKRLLCLAEGLFLASGKKEARLRSTINAEAFYRHHGWTSEGCSSHCLGDERVLPCVLMKKQLS